MWCTVRYLGISCLFWVVSGWYFQTHGDVTKWKHYSRYWPFVWGIHWSPRSFDIFFDLRLNKRLSKQSWGWWFETPSRPLWRHRNKFMLATRRYLYIKYHIFHHMILYEWPLTRIPAIISPFRALIRGRWRICQFTTSTADIYSCRETIYKFADPLHVASHTIRNILTFPFMKMD